MKEVIEHLERMAETLDGVTEENWLDTPQDIAKIYRSVANEIKQKMYVKSNFAAMLKALKNIKEEAETTCEYIDYPIAGLPGERNTHPVVFSDWIIDECNAALSAPPRNIDRFNTPDEALSAYCEEKGITKPLPLWYGNEFWEFINWLFIEAEGDVK